MAGLVVALGQGGPIRGGGMLLRWLSAARILNNEVVIVREVIAIGKKKNLRCHGYQFWGSPTLAWALAPTAGDSSVNPGIVSVKVAGKLSRSWDQSSLDSKINLQRLTLHRLRLGVLPEGLCFLDSWSREPCVYRFMYCPWVLEATPPPPWSRSNHVVACPATPKVLV